MRPPDLHPRPNDRDTTLLVVLIALLSLPAFGIAWVWLTRSQFQIGRAFADSLAQADDDPLVLAMVVNFCLLLLTGVVWIWRDGRRRGIGPLGRTAWVVALATLGSIGLWMYLAARPRLPTPTQRSG